MGNKATRKSVAMEAKQDNPCYEDDNCYMDIVPDEVLVLIFGFVGDAATLLDSVPLVCRRWRRVARDPAAWDGVDVEAGRAPGHPDGCARPATEAEARVVLQAPALRTLRLYFAPRSQPGQQLRCSDRFIVGDLLESALRRGAAQVRELRLDGEVREAKQGVAVEALLRRSHRRVRAVSLCEVRATRDGWWGVLNALVAASGGLVRFQVEDGQADSFVVDYNDSRGECFSRLTLSRAMEDGAVLDRLAGVLRAAAPSLRGLALFYNSSAWVMPRSVRLALAQCRALRSARLPLGSAPAVRGLPLLHSLHLGLPSHGLPEPASAYWLTDVDHQEAASAEPSECEPLPNLRCLGVRTVGQSDFYRFYLRGPSAAVHEEDLAPYRAAFSDLGRLAARATVLEVNVRIDMKPKSLWTAMTYLGGVSDAARLRQLETLLSDELVQRMPAVQAARFTPLSPSALALFAARDGLASLSGRVRCAKDTRERRRQDLLLAPHNVSVAVEVRVPSRTSCGDCGKALAEFRRRRPDVDAKLKTAH